MPVIIRPPAWKPPQGTPLAAGGLAASLQVCVPINEGSGLPVEIVRGVQASSNTAAWVASPYGPALDFSTTPSVATFPDRTVPAYAGPVSFAALARIPASEAGFCRLMSGVGYGLLATIGGAHDAPDYNSSGTKITGPVNVTNDSGWHWWAVSHASAATNGLTFYVDGVPRKTATVAFASITSWLSNVGGNSGSDFIGQIAMALGWSRALPDADQAALAANPWQVFSPPAYRLFGPAAAGAYRPWLYGDQIEANGLG